MRIVQFANFFTPTSGGLRTCVEETGRGFTEAGHRRILVVPGTVDGDVETAAGRRVTIASPPMFGSSEYRRVIARRRVLRLLDEAAPDVLEINDKMSVPWLATWARRRGVPTVLFSHERLDAVLRAHLPSALTRRAARTGRLPVDALAGAVNRSLRRRVDRVVVASLFAAAEFERAGIHDVCRVPLGVDLETFRPREPDTTQGPVRLVLLSRLSPEKCPGLAIEALRLLLAAGLPACLDVVGDGPQRSHLVSQAAGLPVRFHGHISDRAVVADLVARADIALCPSSVETFGLATMEALACGTPVVVPTGGALRELVPVPPAGVICAPTAEELAAGVRRLLDVAPAARRATARTVAQAYPWSRTVDGLLALHSSLTRPATRQRTGSSPAVGT